MSGVQQSFQLHLPQDVINSILMLLAEHPYKISAPLIQAITNQLRGQMEEQPQMMRGNGAGEELRPGV